MSPRKKSAGGQCDGTAAVKAPRRNRWPRTARKNKLSDRFRELIKSLAAIDTGESPLLHIDVDLASNQASADRRAAIAALSTIQHFLPSQCFSSSILYQLKIDLSAVEYRGERPAIFTSSRAAGRKADSNIVQSLKGRFAGMAYVKMRCGMSREQAASWVARNLPSKLAHRVSTKPIRPSTVKEWMAQFGCNAQTRRAVRSRDVSDIRTFIQQQSLLRNAEFNFGEIGCFLMMHLGHLSLLLKEPVPFAQIFDDTQNFAGDIGNSEA